MSVLSILNFLTGVKFCRSESDHEIVRSNTNDILRQDTKFLEMVVIVQKRKNNAT